MALADGNTPSAKKLPYQYKVFKWRQYMGVGYFEARATPQAVIDSDLEMISMEEMAKRKANSS